MLKAYICLSRVVVLDVPLLFEASLHRYVGLATLVYCSPDTQLQRLMQRDGIGEQDARKKMGAQLPIDTKVAMSDQVIHNDRSREETYNEVDSAVGEWYSRTRYWYVLQWICPPLAAIQAAWAVWKLRGGRSVKEE